MLRPEEVVRLAKQNGITLDGPAACDLLRARHRAVDAGEFFSRSSESAGDRRRAKIEILDFSRFGVPRGTFEFPKSSLMPNGLWRGRVLYGENHSVPVWVKTRIIVERTWVEAADTLITGKPIEASQLNVKTGPALPLRYVFHRIPERGPRTTAASHHQRWHRDCSLNADHGT